LRSKSSDKSAFHVQRSRTFQEVCQKTNPRFEIRKYGFEVARFGSGFPKPGAAPRVGAKSRSAAIEEIIVIGWRLRSQKQGLNVNRAIARGNSSRRIVGRYVQTKLPPPRTVASKLLLRQPVGS